MATKTSKRKKERTTFAVLPKDQQLIRQYQEKLGIVGVNNAETIRVMMREAAKAKGLEVA